MWMIKKKKVTRKKKILWFNIKLLTYTHWKNTVFIKITDFFVVKSSFKNVLNFLLDERIEKESYLPLDGSLYLPLQSAWINLN